MYHNNNGYPSPYYMNAMCPWACYPQMPMYNYEFWNYFYNQYYPYMDQPNAVDPIELKDYGREPFVVNLEQATKQNDNYRLALWTGCKLQTTLMSIDVGDDVGLEIHPDVDQFIRVEEGQGLVKIGDKKDQLDYQKKVYDDYAIFIPAGKWHNLVNTGNKPLKLYAIYAPPEHPFGTVDATKKDAEEHHGY